MWGYASVWRWLGRTGAARRAPMLPALAGLLVMTFGSVILTTAMLIARLDHDAVLETNAAGSL